MSSVNISEVLGPGSESLRLKYAIAERSAHHLPDRRRMLVSLCSSGYEVWARKRSLRRELQRRSEVLAESLAGSVEQDMEKALSRRSKDGAALRQSGEPDGYGGLRSQGRIIAITKDLAPKMGDPPPPVVLGSLKENSGGDAFQTIGGFDRSTSAFFRCTARTNFWEPWRSFMTRVTFATKAFTFGAKRF